MTPSHAGRTERRPASPPEFGSGIPEGFTRIHPAVPVILYGPAVILLTALALPYVDWPALVGYGVLGYLAWTLTEYWVHRAAFHFTPRGPRTQRLHWMVHGLHHDHPSDSRRLVLHPLATLLGNSTTYGLSHTLFDAGAADAVTAGFIAGYLLYEALHYHLHHNSPSSVLGRRLRAHHLRHHFQDDGRGFGISCPYWDTVFGTAPAPAGTH
ncbi:hypothetical protein GCM10017750_07890 [Streptomyces racemochromogenes]|uniref:sterol desaturase family protein n=1 Tax=Streptomyces sp. NPDC005180 TaxID=3156868 RepID=UPI0033886369